MITFLKELIPTEFDGYFFDPKNDQLYSIKIGGVLKPLKLIKPNRFNHLRSPAFYISVNGVRKAYMLDRLQKLSNEDYEIPYKR